MRLSRILNRLLELTEPTPPPNDLGTVLPFPTPKNSRLKTPSRRARFAAFSIVFIAALSAIKVWRRHSSMHEHAVAQPDRAVELLAENRLAMQLFYASDFAGATQAFKKLATLDSRSAALKINLGIALRHAGLAEEASQAFEAALLLDRSNSAAFLGIGRLKLDAGRPREARTFFIRALRAGKNAPEALLELGKLAEIENDWKAAAAYYERYLKDPAAQDVIRRLLVKRIEKIAMEAH